MENVASPRQVVFIMTDTQRKDMLGCYGNPDMKTPCLDRLAAQGIRFENAYTCQPVCGPARSALFTGTFPHSNGSWGNTMPIGDTVKTLGQRVSDQDVRAAYIGKWHLDGGDYFGMGRCPDGWEPAYWYDMRNYLEELSEEDRVRSRDMKTMQGPSLTEEFTFGHRCSNRALEFLEDASKDDFLLVVSYDEPHHPFVCPEPYASMYKDYELPKSPNVRDCLENKPSHQKAWAGDRIHTDRDALTLKHPLWFGCNSYVDYEIGRVLDAIEQFAPGALVIYTSDHGDMLESHCLTNKGPVMYEEITNIPFLVHLPGHTPEGVASDSLVSHIDIVPTVLDHLALNGSPVLEGKSLLSVFEHPDRAVQNEVFIEFGRYEIDHDGFGGFQPIRCVYDGRYKLVINLLCEDELYDLQEDPGEIQNLIDSSVHATVRDGLHDRLLSWMNDTRDPFRGYYWERRPWRKDARPATWDYTGMTRQREEIAHYEPRQLDYSSGLEIKDAVRRK